MKIVCTYLILVSFDHFDFIISVSDPDPFHFGHPDPDPFHETIRVAKKQPKYGKFLFKKSTQK